MKFKSALLATAAAVVSTSAFAADAVVEKAPVAANYVKICDSFGAGYFYIPGSDTCLKISGRVRTGFQYVNAVNSGSTAQALVDGRVAFSVAQATELGKAVAEFRIATNSSTDTTAVVNEAYIGIGDFSVGTAIKDATLFDYGSYGDNSVNINSSSSGRLSANGWGVRANHDFGNGFTAAAGANLTSATSSQLLGYSGNDFVLGASATYSSGAIKGLTVAASYDTAAYSSSAGGWGVGTKGEYTITDALSVVGLLGYTDTTTAHAHVLTVGAGAKYTVNSKVALYADAAFLGHSSSYKNGAYANVGAIYTIAKNLTLEAEEIYGNATSATATTNTSTWTTLVRLNRSF